MSAPQLVITQQKLPRSQQEWNFHVADMQTWQQSITSTKWLTPTLQNSWVSLGTPYNAPGYYQDVTNRVHCRGLIKGGTATDGTVLFTLPYKPQGQCVLVAQAY